MNIVMFTNTFTPHVGGVARSIEAFTAEYRHRGHRVMVVAPIFPDMPTQEVDVVRIPAIQNFNASDFSVALPVPGLLTDKLYAFRPDIIHSHHPFLLGMTATRAAYYHRVPLVFTHHTLYEQYTHYVPGDSETMKRFVIELATRYGNLANQVFAPSESIRDLLHLRGVETPIAVVPTGVNLSDFEQGDGNAFRQQMGIPEDAFVVGHFGRLAPEKNLEFLAKSVAQFLQHNPQAHCLIIGTGPSERIVRQIFSRDNLSERLHMAGTLRQPALANALHAMNMFVFASKSETQGMVLTEAMATGLPVVALDAPGAREVVHDQVNGYLLKNNATAGTFAAAIQTLADMSLDQFTSFQQAALETARSYSLQNCADKALACYASLIPDRSRYSSVEYDEWENLLNLIQGEWNILVNMAKAGDSAFRDQD